MKYYPIMGDQYLQENYALLDLSVYSSSYYNTQEVHLDSLKKYVVDIKSQSNAQLLYGGYLEQRAIYTSEHFTGETRDMHLGIDVWADVGTPLYAPIDMILHSMAYNDAELDYGYTIVYYISELDCYLLLGHLSKSSLEDKEVGMIVKTKTQIATLGNPTENGGWEPHVHVQLIKDMGDYKGDYPGVCAKSDLVFYSGNCPSPMSFIFVKE